MLAEAALHHIELVLLEPVHFNAEKEEIQGYLWSGQEWKPSIVRIPEMVIIRNGKLIPEHEEIIQFIRHNRITLRDVGMDKQKTAILLDNYPVRKYLIPWKPVPKEGTQSFFLAMLNQFPEGLVVKRTTANQGKGLIFAVKSTNELYVVRKGNKKFEGTIKEVSMYLEKAIAGRLIYRDFVAQKYIDATSEDGRSFDIRVHVQRRRNGEWGVTRDYIRLAEFDNPLPNTSKGGYQGSLATFLDCRSPENASEIRGQIFQAALDIAKTQDSLTDESLSELGIDLLLDKDFNIWLVETNALPQSFHHEHQRAVYTLEYIMFLFEKHHQAVTI